MNKKNLFSAAALIAFAAASLTSCNQSSPKVEEAASQNAPVDLKIAYVEVDSIMTQYQFCKDFSQVLEKKSLNIQSTLQSGGSKLQAAAANFQQKIQSNAYTREEAERIQRGLQKQQADLEALQARLGQEFQSETDKYNKALRDSLQHFLAVYNKDKKYSLILTKQGDNILLADKSLDITKQVVAGLNKAYKKSADMEKATAKKEEKKD